MHNHSHGSVPQEIIPVKGKIVEAFLGRIGDPKAYFDIHHPGLKFFNDPAFRIILIIKTKDVGLLHLHLGDDRAKHFFDYRKPYTIHKNNENL